MSRNCLRMPSWRENPNRFRCFLMGPILDSAMMGDLAEEQSTSGGGVGRGHWPVQAESRWKKIDHLQRETHLFSRFLFFPLVNFEVVILSLVLTILLIYKSLNHIFLVVLCVVNCICITHVSTSSLYYIIHTLLSDSKSIAYMFGM